MHKPEYSCQVGRLTFHLVHGDIFDVDAEAIVNSEQTDFILSSDPKSISGRIRQLLGPVVQSELDEKTKRQTMPLPTVLETKKGRRIYHAGFHDPRVYKYSWDEETNHLQYITWCIREILECAHLSDCRSLALPLIGTGVFQLDVGLVARKTVDCILHFATHGCLCRDMVVSLVLSDAQHLRLCFEATIEAMAERIPVAGSWQRYAIGVPFLDRYQAKVQRAKDPLWKAWQLIAYVEFLTIYMFSVIAPHASPTRDSPKSVLDEGRRAAFGVYRQEALATAAAVFPSDRRSPWVEFMVELLRVDAQHVHRRLERINGDRNKAAHHEEFRPYEELRTDLDAFLNLEGWADMRKRSENPPPFGEEPWMRAAPPGMDVESSDGIPIGCSDQVGCLEFWKNGRYEYLNPDSGQRFRIDVPQADAVPTGTPM